MISPSTIQRLSTCDYVASMHDTRSLAAEVPRWNLGTRGIDDFFSIYGIQEHHVVGLSELSPYPPSDSSLSKHVAGDSGFRFSARDGEAHRSGAVRP